jgi:hypothetical protein
LLDRTTFCCYLDHSVLDGDGYECPDVWPLHQCCAADLKQLVEEVHSAVHMSVQYQSGHGRLECCVLHFGSVDQVVGIPEAPCMQARLNRHDRIVGGPNQ